VIPEADFYYGAALVRLTKSAGKPLCIEARADIGAGGFEIGGRLLLLMKFCSKRLTPWTFSFPHNQVRDCVSHAAARPFMLCLVCGSDGVVAVANETAVHLLGRPSDGLQSWIRATRRRRERYSVSGLGGDLPNKVADTEFERLAIDLLAGSDGDGN
jgi:hypothetical protein